MEEFTGGKEKDNSNRSIKLLAFPPSATLSTHLDTPHIRMHTNTQKKESTQLIKTLKPPQTTCQKKLPIPKFVKIPEVAVSNPQAEANTKVST